MSVREYIGARYVPIVADPIEWSASNTYEPLTIVSHQGNSYTSRQYVPAGIQITNTTYWALTGNYNAQIEQYRQEVVGAISDIETLKTDVAAASDKADQVKSDLEEYEDRTDGLIAALDASEQSQAGQLAGTVSSGLKTLIDANTAQLAGTSNSGLKTLIDTNTAQLAGTSNSGLKTLIDANTAANTAQAAQLAGTSDSGLKTLIEQIGEQQQQSKGHFGVIGDSFSDGASEWPSMLASLTGLEVVNKAVTSTGFTMGVTPFINQLSNLAADPNFEDCAFIIVYGGLNDYTVNHSSVGSMQTAFSAFKSAYDALTYKPKLIFAFGNCGFATMPNFNGYGKWYSDCIKYLKLIAMPGLVDNVAFWHFPFAHGDVFESDNLHPNSYGHQVIAGYFSEILNGTYSGVRGYEEITAANDTARSIVTFNNGQIIICTALDNYSVAAHNQYLSIGQCSHTYGFGTLTGDLIQPALCRNILKQEQTGENLESYWLCFNVLNRTIYIYAGGTAITTTATTNGSVTANCL